MVEERQRGKLYNLLDSIRNRGEEMIYVYNNLRELNERVVQLSGKLENLVEGIQRETSEDHTRYISESLESSKEAAGIVSPEGMITYVNPAFVKLTGQSAEEVLGRHYVDFLKGSENHRDLIKEYFNNPREQFEEVSVKTDERYKDFRLFKKPFFHKGREHLCTIFRLYPSSWLIKGKCSTTLKQHIEQNEKIMQSELNKKEAQRRVDEVNNLMAQIRRQFGTI